MDKGYRKNDIAELELIITILMDGFSLSKFDF